MAVYAVGDIQGCFDPLRRLLDAIAFDPAVDRLWCTGDLVNRGPDSLAVLRFMHSLGDACITVIGNHDLHLLTLAAGGATYRRDTMREVLEAPDAGELLAWLRHRPLLHDDEAMGFGLVHGGLHPAWDIGTAAMRAARVEARLRDESWPEFCLQLHHDAYPLRQPIANDGLEADLFSVAVLTRARYCTADGEFDWGNRAGPAQQTGQRPWFDFDEAPWRRQRRIVYGHWAAMGLVADRPHVLGLDSGCVWGGTLSAARLDGRWPPAVTQTACPTYQQHA
ncbi:MAG TPA: symmetrical bis(5'-nucleosyl)-tetraphosphatase [Mariprofundaceae bacterium]|nr:symmetrical bis(5'-nucleosyl)-tetraphosphatase [Mariprofundaceae bacterium]